MPSRRDILDATDVSLSRPQVRWSQDVRECVERVFAGDGLSVCSAVGVCGAGRKRCSRPGTGGGRGEGGGKGKDLEVQANQENPSRWCLCRTMNVSARSQFSRFSTG